MTTKNQKITPAAFLALKPGQEIELELKACMGGISRRRFFVGRRSTSKKYGMRSVSLLREKGKHTPARLRNFSRVALYLRGDDVSAAIGDMYAEIAAFNPAPAPGPGIE